MIDTETTPPPASPKRLWGFWATVGFSAAVFTIYFAAQTFVSLIVLIVKFYTSELTLYEALKSLGTDGFALSLATLVAVPLGLLLTIVFTRLRSGISVADYLGWKPISPKTFWRLVLLFIAMVATLLFLGSHLSGNDDTFSGELYRNGGFLPLLWLAIVFLAPLFEEVFFRGFLFVGLRASRLGAAATIVLTSLLWAAMHLQYNLSGIAQIFVVGIILGALRHKTDSLWSPLLIHVLWNGMAMVFTALS